MTYDSNVKIDRWLVWEDLLFDTENWSVHRVVDIWQVSLGWSLSDSSELVVDRSVTQADPSLVGSEIWYWNTSQMSAHS